MKSINFIFLVVFSPIFIKIWPPMYSYGIGSISCGPNCMSFNVGKELHSIFIFIINSVLFLKQRGLNKKIDFFLSAKATLDTI